MTTRGEILRFDSFLLSTSRRELVCNGNVVDIGARAFDLLLALVRRSGEPVSKKTLTDAAWGPRTVQNNNLTVQISALRRALTAHATHRRESERGDESFIRTLPGYGYLFLPKVVLEIDTTDAGPAEPFTQFIGRKSELATLTALLQTNRLVCLIGMGGVGKTRLALRIRVDLESGHPDGVTFLDLAPLTDPARVAEAAAAAFNAGGGGATAEMALITALRSRRLLLIVDNAEHMMASVRSLIQLILPRCPGVSVLVTSRESLGLPGETVFRLQPLSLPAESEDGRGGRLTAAAALGCDAVQLFADRARALLPAFVLVDESAHDAVEICRRLDGIALAIEMAVPLLEILTLRQLAERLHDRFRAVQGSRQEWPPRQRTLRAMFDWSWELLDAQERALLQRLAIFPGGATLNSVTALIGSPTERTKDSEWSALQSLLALVQKSLVVSKEVAEPASCANSLSSDGNRAVPRYQLLETTRQYALERLEPAERDALDRTQALHMAELFEQAEAEWPNLHSAIWLSRYRVEADNLRAAMRWAFDTPDESELALRLVAASLSLWWELPGLPLRESRRWHSLAIPRISPATPTAIQARLWLGQSWTDSLDGDLENFPAAARAVDLFRQSGDAIGLGAALWRAASTVSFRDHKRRRLRHASFVSPPMLLPPHSDVLLLSLRIHVVILRRTFLHFLLFVLPGGQNVFFQILEEHVRFGIQKNRDGSEHVGDRRQGSLLLLVLRCFGLIVGRILKDHGRFGHAPRFVLKFFLLLEELFEVCFGFRVRRFNPRDHCRHVLAKVARQIFEVVDDFGEVLVSVELVDVGAQFPALSMAALTPVPSFPIDFLRKLIFTLD